MAVGDAVNKVNPLFGEGVRSALYSARFAAEALEITRKEKGFSARQLSRYDKMWKQKWGLNRVFAKILFRLFYQTTDKELDTLISVLNKMDAEVLYNLYIGKAKSVDYLKFVKMVPHAANFKTLAMLVKNFL